MLKLNYCLRTDMEILRLLSENAWAEVSQTLDGACLMRQCYYDWDVLEACKRFEASEEWAATRRIIEVLRPPGNIALDLGAGNGIASYTLAKKGYSVIAVEPDNSGLVGHGAVRAMVKATGLPVTVVEAFGEHLALDDEMFALVYARQVLHHAHDLGQMIAEIGRVLKPGGVLVACREHVIDDETSLQAFLARHPLHRYTGNEGAFTLLEYMQAMQGAGFQVRKVLRSWDSVINFYPISCADLRRSMTRAAVQRYGRIGQVLPTIPWWRERYLNRKSLADRSPGRMYTFVATKPG